MTTAAATRGPLATSAGGVGADIGDWRDYVALLKPRVMSLVVFTGLCGLLVAPGHIHPVLALTGILCISVGAGAAGALNQWYEAELDSRMRRTAKRPLPAGRLDRGAALGFGMTLAVGSVLLMAVAVNFVAAALLAGSILFYVVVYTMWLKPRTPQNIVIGGAAGAFPPMIGWAVVTGDVGLLPLLMFAAVFLWTPPHFWALALFVRHDYAAAGVPMLPVVAGLDVTRRQILLYSLLFVATTLLPAPLGLAGPIYTVAAAALGLVFVALAVAVARNSATEASAMAPEKRLFAFSILHLFALFGVLVVDRWLLG